jgi:hypothetical protein
VASASRSNPTKELSDRIRKLHTKEAEKRKDDKDDNSAYEFGAPVNLAWSGPIKAAQDRIAIHLECHTHGDYHENKNHKPHEVGERVLWL